VPYLSLGDVELFYQERGRGPTSLFIHGFALDHTMWLDQLARFGINRRCVAVDLRGCGRSHIGLDPSHAAEYHVGDMRAIMDRLGGGAVDLVGHSMGAHIALEIARRWPSSLRTAALFGVMRRQAYRMPARRPAEPLFRPKEELAALYAKGMLAPDAGLSVRARAMAMTMTLNWAHLYPGTPRSGPHAEEPPPAVRMLFATGEVDSITPAAECAALAAAHPSSSFVAIPGAGHLAPVENVPAVNDALARFWGVA
jgi:pimeloyl-ACP methyl ester carboxylesterase